MSSSASNIFWAKENCCGDCSRPIDWGRSSFTARREPEKPRLPASGRRSRSRFRQLSAVASGVKELREVLDEARDRLAAAGQKTLLFVDEIHRFNRSQQDVLLPDIEEGVVILVGATTQNPFFAINSALVSRSRVFRIQAAVDRRNQIALAAGRFRPRARARPEAVEIEPDALQFLAEVSDGDARRALAALEVGVLSSNVRPLKLTRALAEESVQRKAVEYDNGGDAHYDSASALIKSIRGSDPDAALYWLARMLEGGEEVRFLTRRLVILASEDVGNADPQALPLAVATMQACEFVGLPECRLTLAQAVTYLACAPKSNASTIAIGEATADVREGRLLPVPVHCATDIIPAPSASATARATNTPTTRKTPSRRKTTWASSENTTAPSTVASNANWPNVSNASARN